MVKNDFQYAEWNSLESWQRIHQVAPPCNVTRGCGMTCHWIRPNVRHIAKNMVSISTHHRCRHVIMYQSAKFYTNRTNLGRKKWRHVDFQDGGSQPSWIVSRDPIMGSLKSPCTTSYSLSIDTIALNCLVFETRSSAIADKPRVAVL